MFIASFNKNKAMKIVVLQTTGVLLGAKATISVSTILVISYAVFTNLK